METVVLKFGGTSVGSLDRIRAVARLVADSRSEALPVVVVSAMSGETNRLLGLAREIQKDPDPRELDMLASTGEQASVALLSMAAASILVLAP